MKVDGDEVIGLLVSLTALGSNAPFLSARPPVLHNSLNEMRLVGREQNCQL